MNAGTSTHIVLRRTGVWLASLGGVGYFPIAPATAGSGVTVGLYLLMPHDPLVQLGVLVAVIVLGIWTSDIAGRCQRDPSYVVIDESAGMLTACFLLPKTPQQLFVAFLVFRLLDIGKCFPMKQLEELPGGWGIMADDIAAGLLTRLLLLLCGI